LHCTRDYNIIGLGGNLKGWGAVCWGSRCSVRQRVSSRGSIGVRLHVGRGRSIIGGCRGIIGGSRLLISGGRGSVDRGRLLICGGRLLVGNSRGTIGVNSRRSISLGRCFIFRTEEEVGQDGSLQEGDLAQEQAINQGAASKGRKGDGPYWEEEGLGVCLGGRCCL
jgi:hypothetical protein